MRAEALSTAKQSSAVLGKAQHQCLPLCFFPNMYQLCRVHFSTLVVTFKIFPVFFSFSKVFPVSFGANNLKCVIVPSCADSKCIENTRDFWTHKHNLSSPLGPLAKFGSLQFCVLPKNQMQKDCWFNRMGDFKSTRGSNGATEKIKIQGVLKFIQMLILNIISNMFRMN